MAGSTLKPFAVATGLQEGFSLRDTFDGNSPYYLADGTDVENQGNASYGRVSLVTATKSSINTAFIDLTLAMEDGPEKIIDTMAAAGIPRDTEKGKWGIPRRTPGLRPVTGVALGNSTVSPINMANAYATIANSGERADVHVVERVVDSSGDELYRHDPSTDQTIEADVAADTIYAMQEVMTSSGTGSRTLSLGRPAIGKTGTATRGDGGVSSSWFAGATPQLATAVMMVRGDGNGSLSEITDDGGLWVGDSFAGGYYPAMAWTEIMTAALEGEEVLDFPDPVFMDGDAPSTGHDYVPPTTTGSKPTKTRTPKSTPTGPDPTTPDPTTPDPTTPDPTTPDPTTPDPTTPDPTTPSPTTPSPTTPTTPNPTGGGSGGGGGGGGGGSTGGLSSSVSSGLLATLVGRSWWVGLLGG
jgi:membrane peptidoglycan carboxypeptidase